MTPPILWQPDEARVERATLTRYARWLAERHGVETEGYHDLWQWSVTDLEGFWASIWEFFDVRASSPYERVLGRRDDARRGMVPGRDAQLRRARVPRPRPGGRRGAACLGAAPARRDELGRARGRDAAPRLGAPPSRDRARRPGRRVPAEHPRGRDRLPCVREPRCDLVELLARLRRPQRRRPLRADRAADPPRRRRLSLWRP